MSGAQRAAVYMNTVRQKIGSFGYKLKKTTPDSSPESVFVMEYDVIDKRDGRKVGEIQHTHTVNEIKYIGKEFPEKLTEALEPYCEFLWTQRR